MTTEDHGSCPNCHLDFNGELIWEHFVKEFSDDDGRGYWMDENGHYTTIRRHLSKEDAEIAADKVAEMYGATRTSGRFGKEIVLISSTLDRAIETRCPKCGHVQHINNQLRTRTSLPSNGC